MTTGVATPTIDDIAAEADVSRRTVYTHFPTLDQLLLDAALGALSEAYVDTALESTETAAAHVASVGDDVQARVAALIDALLEIGDITLPLGRRIIKLTVDTTRPAATEGPDDASSSSSSSSSLPSTSSSPSPARRGTRRTAWIEAAVEPLASALTADQHERLVSGLSMVIGFEAMIVMRDVRGLDKAAEADTCRWAARALVDAALRDARS